MLTGDTSFGCALNRLIHKSTERRNGRDFDFLVEGPCNDPVLTAHFRDWGVVTNDWWALFISPLCTSHL